MNRKTLLRWSGYLAFAIVFAIACAYLSHWQFTRNADREEQLSLVAENYDATPVPLGDVLPVGGAFDAGDEWMPVVLHGSYLPSEELLVRNRPHGGTSAFEVLVPFRLDDGRVILVDRGWLPPGDDQPDPEVIPAVPAGDVTVTVRLRPGEALPSSGRSAPDGQVPTINLPLIADTVPSGADMVTDVYGLMVTEDPAPATAPNALESPSEDPGPHLSYAIQWILFAVMGFVFIWYMIRTEVRHRREEREEADEAMHATGAAAPRDDSPRPRRDRSPRRRDRDMEEEDALLDDAVR